MKSFELICDTLFELFRAAAGNDDDDGDDGLLLLIFFDLETILVVEVSDKISSLRKRKMGLLTTVALLTVALLTGLEPPSSWKIKVEY